MSPVSSGSNNNRNKKLSPASTGLLLVLFFDLEDGVGMLLKRLAISGLNGVTAKKTVFFMRDASALEISSFCQSFFQFLYLQKMIPETNWFVDRSCDPKIINHTTKSGTDCKLSLL
jgi:hypothetical protein